MQTGEGKTLTATLPASVAALSGVPVHILTVNDYLTQRDAEEMMPVYHMLGLSVGIILQGMDTESRRQAYACDVVYCSNKELAFDYMKDRILLKDNKHPLQVHAEMLAGKQKLGNVLLLRGLHFAIADEADSVMLDEARSPLIISGQELDNSSNEKMMRQALDLTAMLKMDIDFKIEYKKQKIDITVAGERKIFANSERLGPLWKAKIRALELVRQALSAMHLFKLDQQYLIKDGKVQIIDENTGRVMPDRQWEQGLHQLIEIKEGCEVTRPRLTMDKISFQNFFRRYFHLCGMTGTASDARSEFWYIYQKRIFSVPTNKPCVRKFTPVIVCDTQKEKLDVIASRVSDLYAENHPVLVGLRTVEASEYLSNKLTDMGLAHELLNAKQDAQEAAIVAMAGQPGQITLATNMAGRGTDIKLHESVKSNHGLYVILTELHESKRIDRQLAGRCARQGDPGVYEMILSLDDQILENLNMDSVVELVRRFPRGVIKKWLSLSLLNFSQWKTERQHRKSRIDLMRHDEKQIDTLSFTGNQ